MIKGRLNVRLLSLGGFWSTKSKIGPNIGGPNFIIFWLF